MGDPGACIESLSEAMEIAKARNSPMLMLAVMPRLAQAYWVQDIWWVKSAGTGCYITKGACAR
jgi:hypothetical protein